jgi:hypothetical protein
MHRPSHAIVSRLQLGAKDVRNNRHHNENRRDDYHKRRAYLDPRRFVLEESYETGQMPISLLES